MKLAQLLCYCSAILIALSAGASLRYFSKPDSIMEWPKGRIVANVSRLIDEALNVTDPVVRNRKLRRLITGLNSREIHAMLVRLAEQDGDFFLRTIELELLVRWAEIDPPSALGWVDHFSNGKYEAALLIMSKWLSIDETAAVEWVDSQPSSETASIARSALLHALTVRDPKMAIALLVARPKLDDPNNWELVFHSMAGADLQMAIREANQLPEGRHRDIALRSIAISLFTRDPVAAEKWIKALPMDSSRMDAMNALIMGQTFQNPKEAVLLIVEESTLRFDIVQQLELAAYFWAADDLDGVRSWLGARTKSDVHEKIASTMVIRWVESDAPAAADFALSLSLSSANATVISTALKEWLKTDREAGIAWIDSRLDALPPIVLISIAEKLNFSESPLAAAQLLERLPDSETRDFFYRDLANRWTREDPEAATHWLNQTPERQSRLRHALKSWLEHDPPAAKAWIQSSSVPEDWKRSFLNH